MTRYPASEADALDRRNGLPEALRVLQAAYPRAGWQADPGFGELVRFWMDRHAMFRRLVAALRADAQARAEHGLAPEVHAQRLARLGGLLVQDLHMHHRIEDHHYFPRLVGLVPALDAGFDLLEADHGRIDPLLHELAGVMNRVLRDEAPATELDAVLGRFEALLDRHLTDEEDLIVPVILKSGFDG